MYGFFYKMAERRVIKTIARREKNYLDKEVKYDNKRNAEISSCYNVPQIVWLEDRPKIQ